MATELLQDAGQEKSQWLAEWKKKLIDDFNRKQFSGAFTDTTGSEYTGISSADGQALGLKLPYGIARLPLSRLTPSSTSQADAARQLAEAAAEASRNTATRSRFLGCNCLK